MHTLHRAPGVGEAGTEYISSPKIPESDPFVEMSADHGGPHPSSCDHVVTAGPGKQCLSTWRKWEELVGNERTYAQLMYSTD